MTTHDVIPRFDVARFHCTSRSKLSCTVLYVDKAYLAQVTSRPSGEKGQAFDLSCLTGMHRQSDPE